MSTLRCNYIGRCQYSEKRECCHGNWFMCDEAGKLMAQEHPHIPLETLLENLRKVYQPKPSPIVDDLLIDVEENQEK